MKPSPPPLVTFKDFFDVGHFLKVFRICYNVDFVLCIDILAVMQVGFQLPKQGLNPHHLHWKVKSPSLDCQEVPIILT